MTLWASQLLTLQQPANASRVDIVFDFTATPGYGGVELVEVVMFNCPQWGIAVQTIAVRNAPMMSALRQTIGNHQPNLDLSSCDSLVRLCLPVTFTMDPFIELQFTNHLPGGLMYLAEVTFSTSAANPCCTPGPITTVPSCTTMTPG